MFRPLTRSLISASRSLSISSRSLATFQQPSSWQARQLADASAPRFSSPESYSERSVEGILPFPEDGSQFEAGQVAIAVEPFSTEISSVLTEPIRPEEVEIKPDGVCYLPEIRYRKVLLRAFGPGGWCMVPRGPHCQNGNVLSREYALLCHGRFVAQARGSTTIAGFSNAALASEAVKSNALMRCCKDLGIASELWDSNFIQAWKDNFAVKRTTNDPSGRVKVFWSKK